MVMTTFTPRLSTPSLRFGSMPEYPGNKTVTPRRPQPAALRFGGATPKALPVLGLRNFWRYHEEAAKFAESMGVEATFSRWNPCLTAKILKVIHMFHQAGVDLQDTMVSTSRVVHQSLEKFLEENAVGIALDLRQYANVMGCKFPLPERLSHITNVISFEANPVTHWLQGFGRWLESQSAKLRAKTGKSYQFRWSSQHPLHDVLHEFVHVLHHKNLHQKPQALYHAVRKRTYPESFWKQVAQSVSGYAAEAKRPPEVIAEIGAAQLVGKKLDLTPEIEKMCRDWLAPNLPFGIFKQEAG